MAGSVGTSMAGQRLFLYEAYQTSGIEMSAIPCFPAPTIVMLLSPFLFHEPMTLLKGLSFAVVVAGSLLLNDIALKNDVPTHVVVCGLVSAAARVGHRSQQSLKLVPSARCIPEKNTDKRNPPRAAGDSGRAACK